MFAGSLFSFEVSEESAPMMKHTVAVFISQFTVSVAWHWIIRSTVSAIQVLVWLCERCFNKSPQELVLVHDQSYRSQHVNQHNPKICSFGNLCYSGSSDW